MPSGHVLDVGDVLVVDRVDDVALVGGLHRRATGRRCAWRASPMGTLTSQKAPGRSQYLWSVSSTCAVTGTRRVVGIGRRGDEDDLRRVRARALAQREVRRHPGLEPRRVGLGDAEAQEQRVALQQRRQDRARLQVLPGLHGARLDDARERRAHVRVAQVELRDAQRLLRGGDVGLRGRDARRVLLDLFAGDEARVRRDGSLAARELGLRRPSGPRRPCRAPPSPDRPRPGSGRPR